MNAAGTTTELVSIPSGLVFLLDVDNTLLDNDRLKAYFHDQILTAFGDELTANFWHIYEDVRADEDYVDYPGTIQRFLAIHGTRIDGARLRSIFDAPPFASFVYPDTHSTLQYLTSLGLPVILSDGDPVFQARKIRESGLSEEVGDRVLIYVHKEAQLPSVFARYPADHYVMVDDKARILAELARACPSAFTTVHVMQGHYAVESGYEPAPDYVVGHIGDLRTLSSEQFSAPGAASERDTVS